LTEEVKGLNAETSVWKTTHEFVSGNVTNLC